MAGVCSAHHRLLCIFQSGLVITGHGRSLMTVHLHHDPLVVPTDRRSSAGQHWVTENRTNLSHVWTYYSTSSPFFFSTKLSAVV